MKQVAWFMMGIVVGGLCLWGFLSTRKQPVSFEDLKIAAAPSNAPTSVRSTSFPTPTLAHTASTRSFTNDPGRGVRTLNASSLVTTARPPSAGRVVAAAPPAAPRTVPVPAPAPVPTPTPTRGDEVAIFLDRQQQINTRQGSYRIYVHDHGSETISVAVGYGTSTRVQKAFGSDAVGDNRALIYSDGRVLLYHVNSPRAPQNCCLIQIASAR